MSGHLYFSLGWVPRRSIKICSWGAGEYGNIGIVEWIEVCSECLELWPYFCVQLPCKKHARPQSSSKRHEHEHEFLNFLDIYYQTVERYTRLKNWRDGTSGVKERFFIACIKKIEINYLDIFYIFTPFKRDVKRPNSWSNKPNLVFIRGMLMIQVSRVNETTVIRISAGKEHCLSDSIAGIPVDWGRQTTRLIAG